MRTAPTGKIGQDNRTTSAYYLIVLTSSMASSVVFSLVVIPLFRYEVRTASRSLSFVNSVLSLAEFVQLFELIPSEPGR